MRLMMVWRCPYLRKFLLCVRHIPRGRQHRIVLANVVVQLPKGRPRANMAGTRHLRGDSVTISTRTYAFFLLVLPLVEVVARFADAFRGALSLNGQARHRTVSFYSQ